ncbi:MAG: MMPL family transporter, partial [Chloroflexi bacterium]|nr:MMPL family transporter [Chloroflexota bacterium]
MSVDAVKLKNFGGELTDAFTVPGTESQAAFDLLAERFPARAGSELVAVFHTKQANIQGVEAQSAIDSFVRHASAVDEVAVITRPEERPGSISADGRTALVRVAFDRWANDLSHDSIAAVIKPGEALRSDTLQIDFAGEPVREYETEAPGAAELIGLAA